MYGGYGRGYGDPLLEELIEIDEFEALMDGDLDEVFEDEILLDIFRTSS